jgi:hypothetical protein
MKFSQLGKGVLGLGGLTLALLSGCSSGAQPPQTETEKVGTLNVPLTTFGASGSEYRLRDAVFQITPESWSCSPGTAGSGPSAGSSGSPCAPSTFVSSEDDPDATSIQVTLERGYYTIQLLPGWHMEKREGITGTPVEAQLLTPDTQWLYVQERASTWLEYQFGIGGRELWFNGDVNINIRVYEDPSELGGYGGYGGSSMGGFGTGGSAAGAAPGGGGPLPMSGTGGA